MFDRGGVRTLVRIIAVTALALSAIALAQDATAKGLMYWRFAPGREGPDPFGPFVNRNHFATWAMMAAPLCAGYLAAHAAAHPPVRTARRGAARSSRHWTGGPGCCGGVDAAGRRDRGVTVAVGARRDGHGCALCRDPDAAPAGGAGSPCGRAATPAGRASRSAAALGALTLVGAGAIAARFGASRVALADRLAIWHDTLPVLRDFWLTGTGVGTFQVAMAVYQRSRLEVIFNQAHNHYLQIAAEGGLLAASRRVSRWPYSRRCGAEQPRRRIARPCTLSAPARFRPGRRRAPEFLGDGIDHPGQRGVSGCARRNPSPPAGAGGRDRELMSLRIGIDVDGVWLTSGPASTKPREPRWARSSHR